VGASVWDIWYLLKGLDPKWSGIQFDIRHAMVEGGLSWKVDYKLIKDYAKCSITKDFVWEKNNDGIWKVKNTPIGKGMVDFSAYFKMYKSFGLEGPISMHIEYDMFHGKEEEFSKTQKMTYAEKSLRHDLEAVKNYMKEAGL
jgi:sugar phosphate isomerase/epimerase